MAIEILRAQVLRIFEDNIIPHVLGDLNELDQIQPLNGRNACAVPTGMLILSTLEFVGYLLQEKSTLGASETNIKYAIEYNNHFPAYYNSTIIQELALIYRHGMMHSFYPSQRGHQIYGIHKSQQTDLFQNFNHEGHTIRSLNVNVLSKDFRAYISKLHEELKTTNDEQLLQYISKGFKIIYPSELTSTGSTTPQTTIPVGITKNKS